MAIKTIKIRIKDSSAKKELNKMARAVNFVWNYCNETSLKAIRYNSEWLSGYDLQKLTTGSGKELRISATTIQEVCQEYATRRRQFKRRKLRWRGKKSLGWVPFKKTGISFKAGEVRYSGTGMTLKVFQPERIPEGDYGAGEFCEDSRGRWYLCISVSYEIEAVEANGQIGVDLGLKDVAALSSGAKVSNGRYYRMMERKLAKAQKFKKKRQVKGIYAKIKHKRMDALHKASTKIANENNLIVVGKFSAKKLAKTKMAKSINDAATTMFKTMLRYKASARQHVYVEVNEANTTRTCSSCGVIPDSSPKGLKGLSVREWVCSECGAVHDRDVNAALNILRIGRDALVPEGA
ncbi:transposase [bacterium]|nr:transposase [bacterium]